MRRKPIFIFPCVTVFIFVCLIQICAFAQEDIPSLEAISFKNAVVDGGFSSDVHEYSMTLEDNTKSPTLASYAVRGEADIFINYLYDNANHQEGIVATLQFETGSVIYHFLYRNPAPYDINSNNRLSSVYCTYGVIMPAVNDSDTQYKLYIPSDLKQLKITSVTQDINAYCAPVDLVLNSDQTPQITVSCVASNGEIRNYFLKIKRVDKTVEQVKAEMAQPGYTSFVDGTLLYQKPEFLVVISSCAAGIVILVLLWRITRKLIVNPYDKDEKSFYRD